MFASVVAATLLKPAVLGEDGPCSMGFALMKGPLAEPLALITPKAPWPMPQTLLVVAGAGTCPVEMPGGCLAMFKALFVRCTTRHRAGFVVMDPDALPSAVLVGAALLEGPIEMKILPCSMGLAVQGLSVRKRS